MNIRLEKFKKEDAIFIQTHFPNYFRDNSIENIEKVIDGWKNTLAFCIVCDDEIAGIITLGEKSDKQLSWGVMIREEFRGKGVASRAFELIKEKAKEGGYSQIISSCRSDNVASKRLHEKVGFRLEKTELNQAGREMYRWEMEI